MINFQLFYRKNGIRLLTQIAKPEMKDLLSLELPLNSIYHYCDYEGITDGPINDDVLFKGNKKPIQVSHVTELTGNTGNPRIVSVALNGDIRDYHIKYKRTRLVRNIESASRDKQSIIVYNYNLLLKRFKYVKSFYTDYYQWYNIFESIVDNFIKQTEGISGDFRNHFITANIPKIIPNVTQFETACKNINQATLKIFRDKDSYLLLEIWKWLHNDPEIRSKSILSKIPTSKLHLFNIIYLEGPKWTMFNLGVIYGFSKRSLEDKDLVYQSKTLLDPIHLQKRMLRMQISIMETRSLLVSTIDESDNSESTNTTENDLPDLPVEDTPIVDESQNTNDHTFVDLVNDHSTDIDNELVLKQIEDENNEIENDLLQLSEISKNNELKDITAVGSVRDIIKEEEGKLEDSVIALCAKLADDGLLSAAEYKRFINMSTNYKSIMVGNTPMHEFIKIKPEDLKIESESVIDKDTVLDKSMLKSSLLTFDKKYINEILPKDVFSMVLNVQKAGIVVTDYTVEPVKDILGEYETHVIKLQPVIGKQSTIRFKIPTIREDGIYRSQNILYRMRKQKGD